MFCEMILWPIWVGICPLHDLKSCACKYLRMQVLSLQLRDLTHTHGLCLWAKCWKSTETMTLGVANKWSEWNIDSLWNGWVAGEISTQSHKTLTEQRQDSLWEVQLQLREVQEGKTSIIDELVEFQQAQREEVHGILYLCEVNNLVSVVWEEENWKLTWKPKIEYLPNMISDHCYHSNM